MSERPRLADLPESVDLLVVGGGITGAGVFREAVRTGARVLLVEARDFAGGTSAWSSKLVHGGLRYLKHGQWRLTRESVQERARLLAEAPGLVEPQPFLMPIVAGVGPNRWLMQAGLWVYDRLAGVRKSGYLDAAQTLERAPLLTGAPVRGAVFYEDAQTDDCRLVLRLIFDALREGGLARNGTQAKLERDGGGRVIGARLRCADSGEERGVRACVTVLATGVEARLEDGAPRLRPLRGSHLIFPASRLPVRESISWYHPRDRRPIFAYPWMGAVLYGTTDLDHAEAVGTARITPEEVRYLLEGLAHIFPARRLTAADAIASFSGVRPVVDDGEGAPSAASRENAFWSAPGLVGVTGGKLTTFRVTARQVLALAARQLPSLAPAPEAPLFEGAAAVASQARLYARFGPEAAGRLLQETPGEERAAIEQTPYCWAELRWSARHEQVRSLADLMLRRTRLGLLLPRGGEAILDRVLAIVAPELGWDAARAAAERAAWLAQWQRDHAVPCP